MSSQAPRQESAQQHRSTFMNEEGG
jgi:hypothetical protein